MTGPVLPVSLIKMDLSCRSINNVGQVVVGPGSLVKVNTGIISYNCPVCLVQTTDPPVRTGLVIIIMSGKISPSLTSRKGTPGSL